MGHSPVVPVVLWDESEPNGRIDTRQGQARQAISTQADDQVLTNGGDRADRAETATRQVRRKVGEAFA